MARKDDELNNLGVKIENLNNNLKNLEEIKQSNDSRLAEIENK